MQAEQSLAQLTLSKNEAHKQLMSLRLGSPEWIAAKKRYHELHETINKMSNHLPSMINGQ